MTAGGARIRRRKTNSRKKRRGRPLSSNPNNLGHHTDNHDDEYDDQEAQNSLAPGSNIRNDFTVDPNENLNDFGQVHEQPDESQNEEEEDNN